MKILLVVIALITLSCDASQSQEEICLEVVDSCPAPQRRSACAVWEELRVKSECNTEALEDCINGLENICRQAQCVNEQTQYSKCLLDYCDDDINRTPECEKLFKGIN